MIKHFCDDCGKELRDNETGRAELRASVTRNGINHSVAVMIAIESKEATLELCHGCIVDMVMSVDKRPRPAKQATSGSSL